MFGSSLSAIAGVAMSLFSGQPSADIAARDREVFAASMASAYAEWNAAAADWFRAQGTGYAPDGRVDPSAVLPFFRRRLGSMAEVPDGVLTSVRFGRIWSWVPPDTLLRAVDLKHVASVASSVSPDGLAGTVHDGTIASSVSGGVATPAEIPQGSLVFAAPVAAEGSLSAPLDVVESEIRDCPAGQFGITRWERTVRRDSLSGAPVVARPWHRAMSACQVLHSIMTVESQERICPPGSVNPNGSQWLSREVLREAPSMDVMSQGAWAVAVDSCNLIGGRDASGREASAPYGAFHGSAQAGQAAPIGNPFAAIERSRWTTEEFAVSDCGQPPDGYRWAGGSGITWRRLVQNVAGPFGAASSAGAWSEAVRSCIMEHVGGLVCTPRRVASGAYRCNLPEAPRDGTARCGSTEYVCSGDWVIRN